MGFARFYRRFVFALTAIGLMAGSAVAQLDVPAPPKASLLDLTLTPGGSNDPPGDRLVAAVLIYPGTDRVDLELGAEAVDQTAGPFIPASGAGQVPDGRTLKVPPKPRPVLAKDKALRAPNGRFRWTATARREGRAAAVVEVPIVVPRLAMDLAPRGQLIRYTLRGSVGDASVFSTATRLIDPSGMVRTPGLARPVENPVVMPVEVLFPAPDATGRGRNLQVGLMPAAPGKGIPAPMRPSKTLPAPQASAGGGGGGGKWSAPRAPTAPASIAPTAPSALIPPDQSFTVLQKRPVLFATNRTYRSATGTPSKRFGDAVDPQIRYGSCLVNIPVDKHIEGNLELPGWLSNRDPDKFFLIDDTKVLDLKEFHAAVAQIGGDTQRDVLVYIHGFNTPFDFAVMRLAQVTHDLQFSGVPLAFSWPSIGLAYKYKDDEANAMSSVAALTETLRTMVDLQAARPEGDRGKVHLIAHSLGNRVTLRALEALHGQLAPGQKPFGQIILAAPDVSVAEFTQLVPAAQARAQRVTLYFCPNDEALLASRIEHWNEPRAGAGVVPIPALDNIDARKANTSFLGHGYWADVKQLLIDMQMLVNLGWTPQQRVFTLQRTIAPPHYQFWSFR
jgi:esterase/lipase superfamily enzyme